MANFALALRSVPALPARTAIKEIQQVIFLRRSPL